MTELSHDALARSLADHLRSEQRMTWCDIQLGPSGSPRPDVYTINKSYVSPMPLAYECKVSTSDFRGDITSGKWQSYLRYATGVYFASASDLLSKELVPDHCGLIVRHESGTWRVAKRATLRPVTVPQEALIKLLIDGVEREGPIYRARRWSESLALERFREKFGKNAAKVLSDLNAAEYELDASQRQATRIVEAAHESAKAIRSEASEQITPLRAELCAMLGLEPGADRYQISNAIAELRRALKEHPAIGQHKTLTNVLRRALDSYGHREDDDHRA